MFPPAEKIKPRPLQSEENERMREREREREEMARLYPPLFQLRVVFRLSNQDENYTAH